MFKEFLLLASVVAPFVTSPSNAIVEIGGYEVVNATDSEITLLQGYSDEEVTVAGKTKALYPYKVKTDDSFELYVSKLVYPTIPTDFYYIYKAADYEDPVNITFQDVPSDVWYASVDGYEPSRGIQIGRFESLAGSHAYIDVNKFGISMDYGLETDSFVDLLPDGVTVGAVLTDGTVTSALDALQAYKSSSQMTGSIHLVVLYGNLTHDLILAQNIAKGSSDYQPNLSWNLTFKNQFVFLSGVKVIRYGELEGALPYYFTTTPQGYISYESDTSGVADTLTSAMGLVGTALSLITSAFGWVVFPGVTLGLLLLIPILIGLLVWLIKFLKKG